MFVNNIKLKCFLFKNKYCDEVISTNIFTSVKSYLKNSVKSIVAECYRIWPAFLFTFWMLHNLKEIFENKMTCDDTTEALATHICELLEFYMLPELKEDLDNIQLETSQFDSYHSLLIQDLPKLYDLVQEFLLKSGDAGHEEVVLCKHSIPRLQSS